MTVAVSISTTSLSLIICFDKATTLPPRQGGFHKNYSLLIPLPVPAELVSSIHYRPTSGNMVAP